MLGDLRSFQIMHVLMHQGKEAKLESHCHTTNNSAFVLGIEYVTTVILTHNHSRCQSAQCTRVSKNQHAQMYAKKKFIQKIPLTFSKLSMTIKREEKAH